MKSNKPIIIHLVNSNIFSGLEKVALEIIESLNDKFDFYYACKDGPIVEILKDKAIKRIKISKISKKELLKIEKVYAPDIIHAHDYRATLFCGLYIKETRVIAHLHNNPLWLRRYTHPYSYIFAKACKNVKIEKILTVSNAIEKEYIYSKQIKDKIKMIGNPVSTKDVIKSINSNDKKEYDICFVGRLTKQKNPIRFIRIINTLKNKFPRIRVIMIGDGELKQCCENLIVKLGLNNNIELVGFLKNPYEKMIKCKIFCLTSDWEGYGLVAVEALTLGLPCVVSNVGGLKDIITKNVGALCESNDEFVKEITNLLINYPHSIVEKAMKRAEELDNKSVYMEGIDKLYGDINE